MDGFSQIHLILQASKVHLVWKVVLARFFTSPLQKYVSSKQSRNGQRFCSSQISKKEVFVGQFLTRLCWVAFSPGTMVNSWQWPVHASVLAFLHGPCWWGLLGILLTDCWDASSLIDPQANQAWSFLSVKWSVILWISLKLNVTTWFWSGLPILKWKILSLASVLFSLFFSLKFTLSKSSSVPF